MTQPHVVLYGTPICPHCIAAEQLLRARGAQIEKIRIDNNPEKLEEMIARTGKRTVPQLFIGDRYVGGHDDLVALDKSGELEVLLSAVESV